MPAPGWDSHVRWGAHSKCGQGSSRADMLMSGMPYVHVLTMSQHGSSRGCPSKLHLRRADEYN